MIDDVEFRPESAIISKEGHRYADTASVVIENTDLRHFEQFNDYLPSRVKIYFRYEDAEDPELQNWYCTFDGYSDFRDADIDAEEGSRLEFPCRSRISLLQDDTWTHKWEKAYLKTIIYDLVHGWFPIDFQCPNYYIGDHLIEDKSRWDDITYFAELFACDCYLSNEGVIYFGPYKKHQKYLYQYLNNYPRKQHEQNANINHLTISHMTSQFPYNKVTVVKKDQDNKEIYKGSVESTIPRITGKKKELTMDHKFIQSNKMAQELAERILWKYEREYITATIKSYGVPFINPEHVIELVDAKNYSGFYWVQAITWEFGNNDSFTMSIIAQTRDPKERFGE